MPASVLPPAVDSAGGTPASPRRVPPDFVLTAVMQPGEPVTAVFSRLAATLRRREAELLGLMVYGAVAHEDAVRGAMRAAWGDAEWPLLWVECAACDGAPLAGVQAFAVADRAVTRIRIGRRVVGSVFEDGGARHCLLAGLGPTALGLEPPAQAQQTFGNVGLALELAGFELADVVRTWFYNDDILSWYGDFNRVRTAHYAGVKWRTGSLPASTGIGARNPAGAALQVALWAVQPLGATNGAREIASPLQCPAPAYGSSFSRAMEIVSGGGRRLTVSGTASIHPDGRTAWIGDARKQVDLTMEVIAAILQTCGLGWGEVVRATAYYRHAADRRHFSAWLGERGLQAMPVVHTHSVVCRDDLLFELEVDAEHPAG